ncbi:MAG: GMC family oxidoreductase [Alphaproteobacteria bacterium]|nr:GMC family oxidoreductase [Alphaproteobacteria bacterium]
MSLRTGKLGHADYGGTLEVAADVAVIGAGAGGCAAAFALARRGLKVAVFEEGRHWSPADFKPDNPFALRNLYQDQGTRAAIGEGLMPINGGRGVGGSTLINSAISFRTPPQVLSGWRERFGFDPEGSFERRLDEVWETLGIIVNPENVQGRNNTIFRDGVEALGIPGGAFMHRSAPGCGGCGVCQLGCPSGGKNSADRTFLARALLSGNVGVYADCRAESVESDGGRVTAVGGRVLDHDFNTVGTWRVTAPRFVLSGGPIGSPRFLTANGMAPNDHVGRHLRLHPASAVCAKFDEPIRHWWGVSQGYYVDRWEEGFLLETGTVTPDVSFMALPLALGEEINQVMADLPYLAAAGAMVHDEDTVAEVGATTISFSFGEQDRRRLIQGLRACARIFFAAGARYAVPPVTGLGILRPGDDLDAALSLDLPFHRIRALSSHPMGTCRMGTDPDTSVVGPDGRVWGWENLHVADASVFPSSLGVNPQVTVMACGLMIGDAAAAAEGA